MTVGSGWISVDILLLTNRTGHVDRLDPDQDRATQTGRIDHTAWNTHI
ncbi:hypothetical protein GCM10017653_49840 [Ancylobacter defluvii]|uniref:Uncharacterized protein n=1 Tax=Ancylobacter defluvii TaxID=1282440 RepID=A0A9W6K3R0_9HYPH|nr:hypothetical protein GCM10017653_49840 [Ancylobacter defluvii]